MDNFSNNEVQMINDIGLDYYTVIKSVTRKIGSNYSRLQNAVSEALDGDIPTLNANFYSQGCKVTLRQITNAINNDTNIVEGIDYNGDGVDLQVDDVLADLKEQMMQSKSVIAGFAALEESTTSNSDANAILTNKLNDLGVTDEHSELLSNIRTIVSNNSLNLYEKAKCLLGSIQLIKNDDDEYVPATNTYTKNSPFWVLCGGININASSVLNFFTTCAVTYVKFEKALRKTMVKAAYNLFKKTRNFISKSFTSGERVSVLDYSQLAVPDAMPNYFHNNATAEMEEWLDANPDKIDTKMVIAVPGGYVMLKFYDLTDHHEFDAYVIPRGDKFGYSATVLQWLKPGESVDTLYDMSLYMTTYPEQSPGTLDATPIEFEDGSAASTNNTIVAKSFAFNSYLMYLFCCGVAYQKTYPASEWYNFTSDNNKLSNWQGYIANGTSDTPWNFSGNDIGNFYSNRQLSNGGTLMLDGIMELFKMLVLNEDSQQFNLPYYYTTQWIQPGYHLAGVTELVGEAEKALLTMVTVAAVISITIAIGIGIGKLKNNLYYKQAKLDQALFNENLTLAQAKALRKEQKKVNRFSKLLGLSSSASTDFVSSVSSLNLTNSSDIQSLCLAIKDLIK